jgi:putative endonuclease
MSDRRKKTGQLGEQEACRRLIEDGYAIRDVNWRCRSGEIDIVAEVDNRIVFIEVRSRSISSLGRFGTAAESVDYRKMQKIRSVAAVYLRQKGLQEKAVRFDVITVALQLGNGDFGSRDGGVIEGGASPVIEDYRHYTGAF